MRETAGSGRLGRFSGEREGAAIPAGAPPLSCPAVSARSAAGTPSSGHSRRPGPSPSSRAVRAAMRSVLRGARTHRMTTESGLPAAPRVIPTPPAQWLCSRELVNKASHTKAAVSTPPPRQRRTDPRQAPPRSWALPSKLRALCITGRSLPMPTIPKRRGVDVPSINRQTCGRPRARVRAEPRGRRHTLPARDPPAGRAACAATRPVSMPMKAYEPTLAQRANDVGCPAEESPSSFGRHGAPSLATGSASVSGAGRAVGLGHKGKRGPVVRPVSWS